MIKNQSRLKSAVTLVELLVVVGVAALLAALILPAVKTILNDRKTTNAATMVRNFFEAARARAVGKQVPVAVVLQRLSSVPSDVNGDGFINGLDLVGGRLISATSIDPGPVPAGSNFLPYNTCIQLSMAEQPLPVTSSILESTASIYPYPRTPVALNPVLPVGFQTWETIAYVENIKRTSLLATTYFVAGNEISIGNSNIRHLILDTKHGQATNGNSTDENLFFAVASNSTYVNTLETAIPSNGLAVPIGGVIQFTIFQKPKPINGPLMQMPKGTCIDLSLSGFSFVGNNVGWDERFRFSSTWVAPNPSAELLRPIFIVFTPDGNLSRVYANGLGTSVAVPVSLADDLFLHIGKIDRVVLPVFDLTTEQNLTDPTMYVVRLSGKSGAISVAPANQGVPDEATVGSVLELTRRSTYGASLTGQ
jgi:type II secretory pathway pseudopilin PulG